MKLVELDHEAAVDLVMGTFPYWGLIDGYVKRGLGEFGGESWRWDRSTLEGLSFEELIGIYVSCKESLGYQSKVAIKS